MKNWFIGIGIFVLVVGLFVVPGVQSLSYHTGHGIQLDSPCGEDDETEQKTTCAATSYHAHDCILEDYTGFTSFLPNGDKHAEVWCSGPSGGYWLSCDGSMAAEASNRGDGYVGCRNYGETQMYYEYC